MYSTNLTTCVLFSTIYTFCIICNNTFKIMIFSPNSFTSKGIQNSTVRNESRKLIKQIQIHVHSRPLHIVKTFKAGRREKHVATILNVNNLFCLLIFFSLITLISLLNSSISVTCDPSVTITLGIPFGVYPKVQKFEMPFFSTWRPFSNGKSRGNP